MLHHQVLLRRQYSLVDIPSVVVLKLQLHNGNILVNNMTSDIFNQAHVLVLKRILLYTILIKTTFNI